MSQENQSLLEAELLKNPRYYSSLDHDGAEQKLQEVCPGEILFHYSSVKVPGARTFSVSRKSETGEIDHCVFVITAQGELFANGNIHDKEARIKILPGQSLEDVIQNQLAKQLATAPSFVPHVTYPLSFFASTSSSAPMPTDPLKQLELLENSHCQGSFFGKTKFKMLIKCDLDLRDVVFEFENEEEAQKSLGGLLGHLFTKSKASTLKMFNTEFEIEHRDNTIKVSLVNNAYYLYGITRVIQIALGYDVSLKIGGMHPKEVNTFVLDEFAFLIINSASDKVQFNLYTGKNPHCTMLMCFENAFLKHLTNKELNPLESENSFYTITPKEHQKNLIMKIKTHYFKTKYGDEVEKSALLIQSLFRGHKARGCIKELKNKIAKAIEQDKFQEAYSLLGELKSVPLRR